MTFIKLKDLIMIGVTTVMIASPRMVIAADAVTDYVQTKTEVVLHRQWYYTVVIIIDKIQNCTCESLSFVGEGKSVSCQTEIARTQ